jgi:hypothetical protein
MKPETYLSIILTIGVVLIVSFLTILFLKNMNTIVNDFEKQCSRVSMNEFEDNCFCPCDEPTWIERKLNLLKTCDGWIVKKNESCLNKIT